MWVIFVVLLFMYAGIVITSIRRANNNNKGNFNINRSSVPENANDRKITAMQSKHRQIENKIMISNLENRNNDWLSSQIAHERLMAVKLHDMFGINSDYNIFHGDHADSLDAKKLKKEHAHHCDVGKVDTGGR